jgi:hypothetical protein
MFHRETSYSAPDNSADLILSLPLRYRKGLLLFDSNQAALEFMKGDRDLDDIRARFLEQLGKIIEAAELHVVLRHFQEAVRLFKHVLTGLWQRLTFGISWTSSDAALAKQLEISSRAIETKLASERNEVLHFWGYVSLIVSNYILRQILMFRYIIASDTEKLRELGQAFHSSNNIPAALLCFDHIFNKIPVDEGIPHQKVSKFLPLFSDYIRLLDGIRSLDDPGSDNTCQKLFGIRYKDDDVILPQNSFLCRYASGRKEDEGFVISKSVFQEAFTRSLLHHMRTRVVRILLEEAFAPCIDLITTGRCDRIKSECRSLHIDRNATTVRWYKKRIQHLMDEFRSMHFLAPEEKLPRKKCSIRKSFKFMLIFFPRALICTLYETLHPPLYKLGSQGNIIPSYIISADEGLKGIKDSIRDVCQSMIPTVRLGEKTSYDTSVPTLFMRVVTMAFTFDGDEALSYLPGLKDAHHLSRCFMRDDTEDSCITNQFMSSLKADSKDSILDGIKYLEFVSCSF